MIHFTDDELPGIPRDDPHVQECESCRERRGWPLIRLQALQERLEEERAEANEQVVRGSPLPATAGAVQALVTTAHAQLFRDPPEALRSADEAIRISQSLIDYPRETLFVLRGDAWKERANALRVMGRFPEAIEAISLAQSHYERLVVTEPSLAMVDYVRATIFRETGNLEDALRLARQAERIFARYGYDQRWRHARNLEASIRYGQGHIREALGIYEELLKDAQERADLEDLATLYNNIGSAHVDLDELDAARDQYLQAISLFDTLEMTSAQTRARWGLARLLLRKGEIGHAIRWLWKIHNEFIRHAMSEDTALVALEIASALLSSHQDDEAQQVCEELLAGFQPKTIAGREARTLVERATRKRPPDSSLLDQARQVLQPD